MALNPNTALELAFAAIPDLKHTVCVDFESFWDVGFTLTSMSTSEYVRDKRFKVHCAAISINGKKPKVVWGHKEVGEALRKIDWSTHGLLAQNTAFDGFIMAHCYGLVPCMYFDTKSMAAGLHNGVIRNSLKVLAPLYGVGRKDDTSLQSTKGCLEIPAEWRKDFAQYNAEDTQQCWDIFVKQLPTFPKIELLVIDLVIRMFCDSKLLVDMDMARDGYAAELLMRRSEILKTKKVLTNAKLMGLEKPMTKKEIDEFDPTPILMSNDKFAAALGRFTTVPTKVSPKTGEIAWALAQSDEEYTEMVDHEDINVCLLVRGRLAAKSTQAETRAYRLLEAGKDGQNLPVGYNYSAALTHRLGGTNKLNLQNLPRVNKKEPKPSDALRRSIIAPPGHVLVVCDSAQIEARENAHLNGQLDILKVFANGEDVYKYDASGVFNKPPEDISSDERFIGKIIRLGLGYGMGHKKYQTTLALGAMGPEVIISLTEAKRHVDVYRNRNKHIVAGWKEGDRVLRQMAAGNEGEAYNGLIEFDSSTMWLPNGMPIHYADLQTDENGNLSYGTYKGRKKIYGGKVVENLVQALSRIIVVEQMIDIMIWLRTLKLKKGEVARISLMTHDEVVCIVPERYAQKTLDYMLKAMRRAPEWAPGLPLDAEGKFDRCYSK